MAAPIGLHADAVPLNRLVGDNLLSASDLGGAGFLTNTNVAAADTVTGLIAAVDNASAHADQRPSKARYDLAIALGTYDGSLTDARILSLTTVTGLIGLTSAQTTDSIQQQVPE
jgi:hypothetical protein